MSGAALEVAGLTRAFGSRVVLDALSLQVGAGEVVALMGANGAGKSTLLDLVCGLTEPTAGSVRVFGSSPREAVRAGRVGAMLQSGGLLDDLTVAETAGLFCELFGNRVHTGELLERVGLAGLARSRVGLCSGGEKQRLRWALAQASAPELLVLDEPTAGMDWLARREFWAQVRHLAAAGSTVLYSSHYADEVEQVAGRVLLLADGRILADAPPRQVAQASPTGALFDGLAALLEEGR